MLCLAIALGLCFGSFTYAAYCRYHPQKKLSTYLWQVSFSRSACPCCKQTLKYWQLIPLLSWILQQGRCTYCKAVISISYFIAELFIGCLFALILWDKGISYHSLILLLLACWFMLLALIDFSYYLLPDFLTQPLMWIGLIAAYLAEYSPQITVITVNDALLGILLGYLLLQVPAGFFYLLTKKTGLGQGDVKLLAALGAWLPFTQLPMLLIMASTIGISYFLIRKYQLSTTQQIVIPFGPCLLISGYLLLYFCNDVSL